MRWSVLDRSPFVDFVSWVTLICTNWVQLRELCWFACASLSCASCVVFHELLWVVLSCSFSEPERLLRHCGVGLSAKGMAHCYVQSSCKETNWLLPCLEYYLAVVPDGPPLCPLLHDHLPGSSPVLHCSQGTFAFPWDLFSKLLLFNLFFSMPV